MPPTNLIPRNHEDEFQNASMEWVRDVVDWLPVAPISDGVFEEILLGISDYIRELESELGQEVVWRCHMYASLRGSGNYMKEVYTTFDREGSPTLPFLENLLKEKIPEEFEEFQREMERPSILIGGNR